MRARNLLLARARGGAQARAAECLKQDVVAADVVARAAELVAGGRGADVAAHWVKLAGWSKGSKKILARRAKPVKNEGRTLGWRNKQKKHQCKH